MHNELFSIGPFTVYGYGLMIAIGIFSAYCLAEYRARKIGLDDERVFGLTIWAVIGGIAGGKILYYLTILPQIAADPSLLYRDLMEGFVIYGALIGGFIGIVLYCRHWKMNVLSYLDLALPSVALAQGFGRIGCLLAGCCYGQETDSAFCIVFQNSAYAPNGVPLIPTQIISSALDFLHFGLLILFAKRWKRGRPGGRPLFRSVQRGTLYSGILPGRSGAGKCGSAVYLAVYRHICLSLRRDPVFLGRKAWGKGG